MEKPVFKVLLLDDDQEEFIIIRKMLSQIQQHHFELEWVSCCEAAKIAIAKDEHDVYLIDYVLGAQNGLDLVEELVKEGSKKPMIMLTAHDNFELDKKAIRLGAADFIPKKELSPALLDRTIWHAIERGQLFEKLYYQATHDELTGLYNRKFISDQLATLFSGAKRHGYALTLCLCDIDNFKEINDSFGHHAGDKVLGSFGKILRDKLRIEDIPGRYGGDEFFILFPHSLPNEAKVSTERIRKDLHQLVFQSEDGKTFSVSATFGICQMELMHQTPQDLVSAADRALYSAKEEGRNRSLILTG